MEWADLTVYAATHTAIDVDDVNQPHISYCDPVNGALKYAHKDGAGWDYEAVDATAYLGMYTSIALDATGYPHISYSDETTYDLKYASFGLEKIVLSGQRQGGDLVLTWNPEPGSDAYWVYGASNSSHFIPEMAPDFGHRQDVLPSTTTTWQSPNGIGDPENNWTYIVLAVDDADQEINRSNRVGEFGFGADIP